MACDQITSGGNITLDSGSLGSGFCHKSWQKTYEDFITATTVNFNNGSVFGAGEVAPGTDNVWFKQQPTSCESLGWHYYKDDAWVPVPVPATALPSGVVTASTKGSASANAVVTVDTYGRVTSLSEVAPTVETTDGHAKAWCKFNHVSGGPVSVGTGYNIAGLSQTSTGIINITTSNVGYTNVACVVASSPGYGAEDATSGSYTGADHVRVISSSISAGACAAVLHLPRMVPGAESTEDGDVDWDNEYGDAPTNGVSVVFFGN